MFLRSADKHGREAEHNLDLRIRKTRRAIRSGLIKACQAKPYAHVSVTDICSASMVSRTTFYDHYTDKDALLAEVVSFLLEEIAPALEGLWFGEGRDARAIARHLADVYARNGQALTTLLAIRVGGDGAHCPTGAAPKPAMKSSRARSIAASSLSVSGFVALRRMKVRTTDA